MPTAGDGEVINRAIASNDGALAPSQTQPNDGEECGMSEWMLSTLLAIGFVSLGLAKVLAAPSMRRRAAGGGISPIGALELAGAAGILVGLVEPFIGVLAAAGSLLLLTGALFAHARHRDTLHEAAPAVLFSLIDAASLGLAAAGLR